MTRATGIVRKIDELGRFVMPKELRRSLNINEGDSMEVFTGDNGEVILKKYQPGCISCGAIDDLKQLPNGTRVCSKCINSCK